MRPYARPAEGLRLVGWRGLVLVLLRRSGRMLHSVGLRGTRLRNGRALRPLRANRTRHLRRCRGARRLEPRLVPRRRDGVLRLRHDVLLRNDSLRH